MVFDASLLISKYDLETKKDNCYQLSDSLKLAIIGSQFHAHLKNLPFDSKILIILDGVMIEETIRFFDEFKVTF